MSDLLEVADRGDRKTFTFEEMLKYHGPEAPGGVAHSFKVLQRALPLLDGGVPPERRKILIETAFGGPGARDGFELVTRAFTEGRYLVDPSLKRPDRGWTLERYVFRFIYGDRKLTLLLREGYIDEEFVQLARKEQRSSQDLERLTVLKQEMADRLMANPAIEVYDVVDEL